MSFRKMHPLLAKEIQRKGGKARVKKGFGVNPDLARQAGSKGGKAKHANRSKGEAVKKDNSSGESINLADLLGNLND